MSPLRRLYKRSHRLRRFIRRRKDAFAYHAARFALWVPRQMSLARALALADRIGDLAFALLTETRQRALTHLEMAFGEAMSPSERNQVARASLRNAARCFVEVAKIDTIRPQIDSYCSIEGLEHLEAVQELGRGAIVITGHIGNWELLAGYFALKGLPISAIARRINDPRLNQLLVDFRASNGVRSILRESASSSREILKILNARGILALIIDQDMPAPSVSVPFFGRPARTPVAAAALSLRRNLPVVPVFAQRRPEGGLRFIIMPAIMPTPSGDRRRDIIDLTRRFSDAIEERIRMNPAEWVWWHKRWRRQPVPKLDIDAEMPYSNNVLR